MKTLFFILSITFVIFGFSQNLPNIVDVHIENFNKIINSDTVSIDSALVNSDEVTEEITSCNYTLDFISKKCMLFFEGAMIADVGILNIESKGNKHIITLDDLAIETKIILDLDSKNFIYYYIDFFGEYVITKPTKFTIASF
jgi:hypothetical protein